MYFFFYGLSIALYTLAAFLAGMYVGEKLEKAWAARERRGGPTPYT